VKKRVSCQQNIRNRVTGRLGLVEKNQRGGWSKSEKGVEIYRKQQKEGLGGREQMGNLQQSELGSDAFTEGRSQTERAGKTL